MRDDIFRFIEEVNNGKINFAIPVLRDGVKVARLRPITRNLKQNEVKLMALWRASNQHVFKDPNPITVEGTKKWFLDTHKDRRLLFFIKGDAPIGHMGIYRIDISSDSLEIDNVIRGTKQIKGVMHLSLSSLVHWTKKTLKPRTIYLAVSQQNIHAVEFYKRNYFTIDKEIIFRDIPHYRMRYK